MVSTRGVKLKFYDGERVLCYEPDPTKAKVLYDSKVLEVVQTRDARGRKQVEYLIHFQGWNSSWDRCVKEEYVLKDTAENRQLQKDLAEKSQLQLGAYLYRRERKKRSRAKSVQQSPPEDGIEESSPVAIEEDDNQDDVTSSDDMSSSNEEEMVQIELTANLRHCLEHDNYLINTKYKLPKLPAEPNVVNVLEMYWKHYATSQICGINDKPNRKYRPSSNSSKTKTEDIFKNLNVCKEMVDGLRIYFDFLLNDLLLYKREKGQMETCFPTFSTWPNRMKFSGSNKKHDDNHHHHHHHHLSSTLKNEEFKEYAHLPNASFYEDNNSSDGDVQTTVKPPKTRRLVLRSGRSVDTEAVKEQPPPSANGIDSVKQECSADSNGSDVLSPLNRILTWRLLPEEVYSQKPPPPCLVYGATHLTRLLVKLPELLNTCSMAEERLKALLNHIDLFIDYINEHKDWYGDKHYIDAP